MTEAVNDEVVFLRGRKVNLILLNSTHIPLLTRWVNDPDIRPLLNNTRPMSEDMEREWFSKLNFNENIVLGIQIIGGPVIGTMGLHHIKWRDRIAATGANIGEKKYWNKGYGTDAKMALLNYAFNQLNLHKICSGANSSNKRSIAYSKRCGYKVEAVRKKHVFSNGRYIDIVDLAVFKKDWLPIWKRYQRTGKVR